MSAARRITVTGHGLVVVSNLRQSGHGEWQCEVSPGVGETGPDRATVRAAFEDTDTDYLNTQLAAAKASIFILKLP